MLNTIKSHKFQEGISYYTEDIEDWGCDLVAPGVGDLSGDEYDVIFDQVGDSYYVRDIVRHNER